MGGMSTDTFRPAEIYLKKDLLFEEMEDFNCNSLLVVSSLSL